MIYGFVIADKNELVIVAGDTIDEQQSFLARVQESNPNIVQENDITRFMMDKALQGLKRSPAIFEFGAADEIASFVAAEKIDLITPSFGRNQQERMLMNQEFDPSDQRTIAEINGITDEHDPWSKRTDEQKAAAAARSKQMKDKRKSGDVTGDSYGGGEIKPNDGDSLNVRDAKITMNDDGTISFGDVYAEKGVWDRPRYHVVIPNGDLNAYIDLVKRAGLMNENDTESEWEKHPEEGIIIRTTTAGGIRIEQALEGIEHEMTRMTDDEVVASDDWKIADDDLIAIYFRVDVPDLTIAAIQPVIDDADSAPFKTRDVAGFGCWLAFMRERAASKMIEALSESGVKSHLSEVDRNGDRIVEEGAGAVVVDTEAEEEEPPLPWNDRAAEFAAMDEKEQRKTLRGKYLLYTVRDYGLPHGRVIHITPKSIFKATGRIWDGDIAGILKRMLPPNIEKMGDAPGRFQCKSLDLNATDFTLGNKAEMIESLNLRMWVNGLPNGDQNAYDAREG